MNRMPGKRDGSLMLSKQLVAYVITGLRTVMALRQPVGFRCAAFSFLVGSVLLSSISSGQADYYKTPESDQLEISQCQSSRYNRICVRKSMRLTRALKKINDKYLEQFLSREEDLCHSFCEIDEQQAERLFAECSYALNRFQNKLNRGIEDYQKVQFPELDTLITSMSILPSINHHQEHSTHLGSLQFELHRNASIEEYILKRVKFWQHSLQNCPLQQSQLIKVIASNYYFNASTEVRQNIFEFRNRLQGKVIASVRGALPDELNALSRGHVSTSKLPLTGHASSYSMKELLVDRQQSLLDLVKEALPEVNPGVVALENYSLEAGLDSISEAAGDSSIVGTDDVFDQLNHSKEKKWKPNDLKAKRFVDRIEYNTSFSNKGSSIHEIRNGTAYANILYRIRSRLSAGLALDYGYKLGPFNLGHFNEPRTTYFLKPEFLRLGQTVEWRFRKMISFKNDLYLHQNLISPSQTQRSDVTWRAGLKFTIPKRGRTKPTAEFMIQPLTIGSEARVEIRIGFNIRSQHSGS